MPPTSYNLHNMIPPELWWLRGYIRPPEPEPIDDLWGWRMLTPWDLMTPEMRQRVIEYYSTHPEEYNPYYEYTRVGTPNPYLDIEYVGGTAFSNSTSGSTYPVTTDTGEYKIHPSTNILISQYLSQYWWVALILIAIVLYFVFSREKRRRG